MRKNGNRIVVKTPDPTQPSVSQVREFTDARGARRTEWWCPQGRPDHYDSCELMQIACASARGILSAPREIGPLFEHAAGQKPS